MTTDLVTLAFWAQVLAGGVRLGIPVGLAALGENIGERSGVFNIGIEGTMAIGALAGYAATVETGNPYLGFLAGITAGVLAGLGFAAATIWAKGNEVVVGFAFALTGTGLATFLYRIYYAGGRRPFIPKVADFKVPLLEDLPLVGLAFQQTPVMYLVPVFAILIALMLFRTKLGLELRASGENPQSAEARGVRVRAVRTLAQLFAGALVGLAGAILSVGLVGAYEEGIVGGRGFVAIALVIVGRWRPGLIAIATLGFGTLQSLALRIQGELSIPSSLLVGLPFAATLLVMALSWRGRGAPADLGRGLVDLRMSARIR